MKSKRTFFNKTIYCKNVIRMWPLWGILSVIGFIGAVANINQTRNEISMEMITSPVLSMKDTFYEGAISISPLILLVYAVVVGAIVWGYLYTRKGVDFFHSLPESRSCLFVSSFLSGLTVIYIPFAVFGVSLYLGSILIGCGTFEGFITFLWITLAYAFVFFGIETLVAMLTGTKASNVILYFILNYLSLMLESVLSEFKECFLYGVDFIYNGVTDFLSPCTFFIDKVVIHKEWEDNYNAGYYSSNLRSIDISGKKYILIYVMAILILLALSYCIYYHRKSEKATEVVAFKALKEILLYVLVLVVGTWGTMIICQIFTINQSYAIFTLPGAIAAALIAVTLSYYAIRMILDKTIKVFNKKNVIGWICALVGFWTICTLLAADLTGEEAYVPEISDIEYINLYNGFSDYDFREGEEKVMEEVTMLHRAIIEEGYRKDISGEYGATYSVTFEYDLKNGDTVRRSYSLPLYEDKVTEAGTLEWKYNEFLNLKPVIEKKYLLTVPKTENEYVSVRKDDPYGYIDQTYWDDDYEEFDKALKADYAAGNLKGDEIFYLEPGVMTDDSYYINISKISDETSLNEWGGMSPAIDEGVSFRVTGDMTHILEFIESRRELQ